MSSRDFVENLENRQLFATQYPMGDGVIQIKVAKVSTSAGIVNQSRIIVNFAKPIRLGDTTKFSMFGYANDLKTQDGQVKVRVGLNVTATPGVSNSLTILTDRLIRKGSRLIIAAGGLTNKAGDAMVYDASTTGKTISMAIGQNKPRYTLANRNFKPTDLSYFENGVFTGAPTPQTASTEPSATTVRANLVTFMKRKLSLGTITKAQYNSALSTFDASSTAAIIPSANLRAALVSLTGTVAEPAINSILTKNNVTGKAWSRVEFSTDISPDAAVGETRLNSRGYLATFFKPAQAGESFVTLSAQIAHEATRQDPANGSNGRLPDGQEESIIANTIETTVYAQQLLVDSSSAANGTTLVTRSNTRLLAFINSGQAIFPFPGIFQDQAKNSNGNVFVGAKSNPDNYNNSNTVHSYEDWIRREYKARGFLASVTDMNPMTRQIVANMIGADAAKKLDLSKFNTNVEQAFDGNGGSLGNVLNDQAYIRLSEALKLTF